MRVLQEKYNQLSKGFRASNFEDKQLLEALFDLKDALEKKDRVLTEHVILVGVYTLLDFHAQAYVLFEEIADRSNRKEVARLAVLKEKAATHHDTFARKDPRKVSVFLHSVLVDQTDFIPSDTDATYQLQHKTLVIFQQRVASKRISLRKVENSDITAQDIARLNQFLLQLGEYKDKLIQFYNTTFMDSMGFHANALWYAQLDVYSVNLIIETTGVLEAWITVGDQHFEDHLLDIYCDEQGIESMNYDG